MYPLTFYIRMSGTTVGFSKGPLVFIREDMKGDKSILPHELTHVKQWLMLSLLGPLWAAACYQLGYGQWANLGILSIALHQVLYTIVTPYRQWAEVQAYKVQIKNGAGPNSCALSLSRDYGLSITQDEALALLT